MVEPLAVSGCRPSGVNNTLVEIIQAAQAVILTFMFDFISNIVRLSDLVRVYHPEFTLFPALSLEFERNYLNTNFSV